MAAFESCCSSVSTSRTLRCDSCSKSWWSQRVADGDKGNPSREVYPNSCGKDRLRQAKQYGGLLDPSMVKKHRCSFFESVPLLWHRVLEESAHLVPLFFLQIHLWDSPHTIKWMHLLVLPPLGHENCSESSDVKCPGQISSNNKNTWPLQAAVHVLPSRCGRLGEPRLKFLDLLCAALPLLVRILSVLTCRVHRKTLHSHHYPCMSFYFFLIPHVFVWFAMILGMLCRKSQDVQAIPSTTSIYLDACCHSAPWPHQ